jgi:hypothetical protein
MPLPWPGVDAVGSDDQMRDQNQRVINLQSVNQFVSELHVIFFECSNAPLQSADGFVSQCGVYLRNGSGETVHRSRVGAHFKIHDTYKILCVHDPKSADESP